MRHSSPRLAMVLAAALALGGCNTPDALNPAAIQPVDPPVALPAPDPLAPPAGVALPRPAEGAAGPPAGEAIAGVSLHFAPVVGATVDAAIPLSRRLILRAGARGVAIAGDGVAATHVLKGYFSALSEGGATIVVFVWDVVGPTGNRLHRIQGQERVPATAADAWTAVPAQTMEAIADRTMEQLLEWLASQPA